MGKLNRTLTPALIWLPDAPAREGGAGARANHTAFDGRLCPRPERAAIRMEKLWAPWRMAYVGVPQSEGCVFCSKPGLDRDREELILYRGETCFIIMNLFPYNNGHVMVVPFRHTADFQSLTTAEQAEMMRLTQFSVRVLEEAFHPDAYNIGMNLGRIAGAGIAEHLHMHIVPRWNGDTNFMPVIAETKVLPDALFGGYDKLKATVDRLSVELTA